MRAKKLYTVWKELQPDDTMTVVFDLMQNQSVPKLPIGEAYYTRQLWLYVIAIVEQKVGQQTRDGVSFYSWGKTSTRTWCKSSGKCGIRHLY